MHITPFGGAAGTGVSEAKLPLDTGQAAPITGAAANPTSPPVHPAILHDTAVIRELAVADLLKLTQILQPPATPERVGRVESLIEQTVQAIREDRREWAVGRLIEAVTTDPTRADEFRSNPELEAIQPNVDVLLNRLTNVAKMDAETKLATAEQIFESSGWQKLPHWETSPAALIQIGHRLLEAGGYANYVRTSDLATTLQSAYWSATLPQPAPAILGAQSLKKEDTGIRSKMGTAGAAFALAYHGWDLVREKFGPRIETLWQRAPVLVILGAWFMIGFVGGGISFLAKQIWPDSWIVPASNFGFDVWGVGFLAIVGFQFWARVRRRRS